MKYFFYLFLLISFPTETVCFTKQKGKPAPIQVKEEIAKPVLYSRHWFDRLPLTQKQNPILIHDLFIISFDLEKKFPTWLAYQLSPKLVWGSLKAERKYKPDPLLPKKYALQYKDYKGASNCDGKAKGYDKGHLAPLGSFKASQHIYQAQYLSNIVPQKRNLNQGPWKKLEELVRDFVKKGNTLHILTGPLYGKEGEDKTAACWKAAQGKITEIPVSYWKVIVFKQKKKLKACAVLMPQNIRHRKVHPKKYQVQIEDLETKIGFTLSTGTKKALISDCEFLF